MKVHLREDQMQIFLFAGFYITFQKCMLYIILKIWDVLTFIVNGNYLGHIHFAKELASIQENVLLVLKDLKKNIGKDAQLGVQPSIKYHCHFPLTCKSLFYFKHKM